MKRIYFILAAFVIAALFSSCSMTKYEARTYPGVRSNVLIVPMVAEVSVDINKKITGQGKSNNELAAKEAAIYNAIQLSGADMVIDPIYVITISRTSVMAQVTGFYGKYKEIRKSLSQLNGFPDQLPKDINTDAYGESSILKASQEGDLAVVKILIDRGVDLNIWNHEGRTPLMLAVANEYVEVVEVLLENKANVNMKVDVSPDFITEMGERVALLFMGVPAYGPSDPDWKTALDFVRNGNTNIVSMLLDAGAKSGQ